MKRTTRAKRAKLTLNFVLDPADYQAKDLPGWKFCGCVVEAVDGTGALMKNLETGIYCRANNGKLAPVGQRKVERILISFGWLPDED